jgi:hypothetical protein
VLLNRLRRVAATGGVKLAAASSWWSSVAALRHARSEATVSAFPTEAFWQLGYHNHYYDDVDNDADATVPIVAW